MVIKWLHYAPGRAAEWLWVPARVSAHPRQLEVKCSYLTVSALNTCGSFIINICAWFTLKGVKQFKKETYPRGITAGWAWQGSVDQDQSINTSLLYHVNNKYLLTFCSVFGLLLLMKIFLAAKYFAIISNCVCLLLGTEQAVFSCTVCFF